MDGRLKRQQETEVLTGYGTPQVCRQITMATGELQLGGTMMVMMLKVCDQFICFVSKHSGNSCISPVSPCDEPKLNRFECPAS